MSADPLARLYDDPDHSDDEQRLLVAGHSFAGRVLFVVHVENRDTIRIIGARLAKPSEELAEAIAAAVAPEMTERLTPSKKA